MKIISKNNIKYYVTLILIYFLNALAYLVLLEDKIYFVHKKLILLLLIDIQKY